MRVPYQEALRHAQGREPCRTAPPFRAESFTNSVLEYRGKNRKTGFDTRMRRGLVSVAILKMIEILRIMFYRRTALETDAGSEGERVRRRDRGLRSLWVSRIAGFHEIDEIKKRSLSKSLPSPLPHRAPLSP